MYSILLMENILMAISISSRNMKYYYFETAAIQKRKEVQNQIL